METVVNACLITVEWNLPLFYILTRLWAQNVEMSAVDASKRDQHTRFVTARREYGWSV